jgi:hypothetical protein
MGLLQVSEKGALFKRFENRTITFAAVGARNFGEGGPTDNVPRLGMIPYEGCAVYQLSETPEDPILARAPNEKLDGHLVWESKGSEGGGPDWETFYVSMLEPQLLTVCNNHAFLEEVLAPSRTPPRTRALPPNLPEWPLVDRGSAVWGISHYRDGGGALAMLQVSDATGVAVNFGKTTITARMVSATDPWEQLADVPDFNGQAKASKAADGVWELTVPAQGQPSLPGVFLLMGVLGFVVVI